MLTVDSKNYARYAKLIGKSFFAGGAAFAMAISFGPVFVPAPFLGLVTSVGEIAALVLIDLKRFDAKKRFQTHLWFISFIAALATYILLRHQFVLEIPGSKESVLLGYDLLPIAQKDTIALGSDVPKDISTVMKDFGYDPNDVFTRLSLGIVKTALIFAWSLLFFTLSGFLGSFARNADHETKSAGAGTQAH